MTDKCKERKPELRGKEERIYFYLTIRAECSKLRWGRYGRWGCNSGGSQRREVFPEKMTIQIKADDTECLRVVQTKLGRGAGGILPLGQHAGEDLRSDKTTAT